MTEPGKTARDAALHVHEKLRAAGFDSLFAGGCVRDLLLNREPKDYDVATSATPAEAARVFPKARLVGAKFGVVLVRKYGHDVEVATFRKDGHYSDGRRPDGVEFGTPEEDAQRRDFTINGLFMNPSDGRVIDHVGGRMDLERRVVRTIGNPDERFAEDHLRLLRAARFAAGLGFALDPNTESAMTHAAEALRRISPERVWMELERMLCAPSRAEAWDILRRTRLACYMVSGWGLTDDKADDIGRRLANLSTGPISPVLALGCLWADEPEGVIPNLGESLRLSNRLIDGCRWLVSSLPAVHSPDILRLWELKTLMAHRDWSDLPPLLGADLAAKGQPDDARKVLLDRASRIDPDKIAPPPFLTGDELARLGVPRGPEMGVILKEIYRAQLDEVVVSHEQALGWAKRLAGLV